jgi:hypothetical protein
MPPTPRVADCDVVGCGGAGSGDDDGGCGDDAAKSGGGAAANLPTAGWTCNNVTFAWRSMTCVYIMYIYNGDIIRGYHLPTGM